MESYNDIIVNMDIVNEKNIFRLLFADIHEAYEVSGCARKYNKLL